MSESTVRRSTRTRKQAKKYGQCSEADSNDSLLPDREGVENEGSEGQEKQEEAMSVCLTATKASSASSDSDDTTDDSSEDTKTAPKSKKARGQLYGAPAAGSLISGVKGRAWKQPKVYALPKHVIDRQMKGTEARISLRPAPIAPLAPGESETRVEPTVKTPPDGYFDYLHRATTQRMFVLTRTRGVEEPCHAHHTDCPYEVLEIAGSKGDVYTVRISHRTQCSCPNSTFKQKSTGQQCKHILYILHHVLKAPDELKYQTAFLTADLKNLFANAPPLLIGSSTPSTSTDLVEDNDGHRKPVEGDCPICYTEFDVDKDDIVWCRAACGNNIHQTCFAQWETQAKNNYAQVRCPFCRSDWKATKSMLLKLAPTTQTVMPNILVGDQRGRSGYRNVYDQLDYGQH